MRQYRRIYSFLKYNPNKYLYLKVWVLSGIYRLGILVIPMRKFQYHMGRMNEESAVEGTEENNRKAANIAHAVERVCQYTPWKSKCLVKALTAQHLLKKFEIPSTLYLGVVMKDNSMKAHAWIRSGKYYISGGNGDGYTLVAKFRA